MLMSKQLHKAVALLLTVLSMSAGTQAQVLPILGSFRGSTFRGTLDVSWPAVFENCTFVTDSVVLRHSYGALFRNCRFESLSGVLYMAQSGSGMILTGCEVTGCSELRFSRTPSVADRNYVADIKVNGEECPVTDDQETIIDIDGLELYRNITDGKSEPLFMLLSPDRCELAGGQTAVVSIRGLKSGMFVGWQSSDPSVRIVVDDPFVCRITAPEMIAEPHTAVISAYTEYGLEAACEIRLVPDRTVSDSNKRERKGRKRK